MEINIYEFFLFFLPKYNHQFFSTTLNNKNCKNFTKILCLNKENSYIVNVFKNFK